jgi:hypothetical protein
VLIRHQFGSEGHAYLRSYLEANEAFGKRLGRLLLTHHDIDRGRMWAFVPADSLPEHRTDFARGGLLREVDSSLDEVVGDWLLAELRRPSPAPRIVCVEGALERRTDGWLTKHPEYRVFFCGEDPDTYETTESPLPDLDRWCGGADWRPDLGIIAPLPAEIQQLTNRQSVPPDALEEMAAAASVIIVGAWDDEAFLFWQPSATDGRA